MKFKDKVSDLLSNALKGDPRLFLIELRINSDNSIKIDLDGDKGVALSDCIMISREIEHNLDREEHDFSLEVGSVGVDTPLVMARQYKKNNGKILEVKNLEGDLIKGELTFSDDKKINLKWKVREPKPIGKGKITVVKTKEIEYKDIVQARVII
tara:strand:+ start:1642 stop:2103 length:462 start_codon:yes stop_codon:yes gene_type:complete